MNSMFSLVRSRQHVARVDDERSLGNGVIVTLRSGFFFLGEPGCGVRGFDNISEAERGTRTMHVYRAD